jgi:Amt family ammonium transporter
LVLMMSIPGLALFYGGMVRKKNVLATLMQTFAITCVVTMLWWLIGYSWAFTPGSRSWRLEPRLFNGMTFMHDPVNKLSVSHLALDDSRDRLRHVSADFRDHHAGADRGRVRRSHEILGHAGFHGVWSLAVYAPIAHMVWEPTGWLNAARRARLRRRHRGAHQRGHRGPRQLPGARQAPGLPAEAMPPHNLTLTLIGASLLWVGWFGFNAGSAGAADGRAGMAMLVTQMATAAAALGWMFAEWISKGKPSVLGIASGAVAGLVAITPASGFVGPTPAVVIGLAAGVLCFIAATSLKHALGYDDSLDAFGVHGIGGIIGALLTGVFVSKEISGVDGFGAHSAQRRRGDAHLWVRGELRYSENHRYDHRAARHRRAGTRRPGYFAARREHRIAKKIARRRLSVKCVARKERFYAHPERCLADRAGFIALSGLRVAQEYERGVVFRLGRYMGLRGPGACIGSSRSASSARCGSTSARARFRRSSRKPSPATA